MTPKYPLLTDLDMASALARNKRQCQAVIDALSVPHVPLTDQERRSLAMRLESARLFPGRAV